VQGKREGVKEFENDLEEAKGGKRREACIIDLKKRGPSKKAGNDCQRKKKKKKRGAPLWPGGKGKENGRTGREWGILRAFKRKKKEEKSNYLPHPMHRGRKGEKGLAGDPRDLFDCWKKEEGGGFFSRLGEGNENKSFEGPPLGRKKRGGFPLAAQGRKEGETTGKSNWTKFYKGKGGGGGAARQKEKTPSSDAGNQPFFFPGRARVPS